MIRPGFRSVTPYLHADGAEKFIHFAEAAFGAKEQFRAPREDGSLQHAEIRIGDCMLELADPPAEGDPAVPVALHYYVDDVDAVYKSALAAGATSIKPPTEMPYEDREASVADPFGNHWYIATHLGATKIRENLAALTICLRVEREADFIEFLKQAFDAEELVREEGPDGGIRYSQVRIGTSVVEPGQATEKYPATPCPLHVYVADCDATLKKAVAAGATVLFEVADQPYGERSGGVTDPFGNSWYIATWQGILPKS